MTSEVQRPSLGPREKAIGPREKAIGLSDKAIGPRGQAAVARGRLAPPASAPARGELDRQLVSVAGLEIRQILSGELEAPSEYCQDDDEWALVVTGSASLVMGTEVLHLETGDWVWIPAGTAHRLERTEPGTSWVTVHGPRPPASGG
jgi:cupin 2 domain-containing protein